MTIRKVKKLLESTQPRPDHKGKVFTIRFIKRDDTDRVMRARLGVVRGLTYEGQNYDPEEKDIKTVWDTQNQGYRNIRLDSILEFNGRKL